MLSISKKRLLREKFKNHLFSSFQKTKLTQTSGSVFAKRTAKVERTKHELELNKIAACFLDDHGNFEGNLVSFQKKNFVS